MESSANANQPTDRDLRALRYDQLHFLRLLILDVRFAMALGFVVLMLVACFVSLPKFWVTTPSWFRPQVRVSLLNLVQAWKLRQSAGSLEAQGRTSEALQAWHQAFRRNLGDLDTSRSVLRVALAIPTLTQRMVEQVADVPGWLLSLSRTNEADVLLVARFLDRAGFRDDAFSLLDPLKDRLSPEGEVAYLKSLLERGAEREYTARWKRSESLLARDPEFAAYHAVYLAAWGPVTERASARDRLAKFAVDPALRAVGLRLQLLLAAHTGDVPAGERALEQLESTRQDRLRDHILYWGLLVQAGRQAEVRRLLEQRGTMPGTALEVITLAGAYRGVGMEAEANRLLKQAATTFGGAPAPWVSALWLSWANLLISTGDWQGVHDLVDRARASPEAMGMMGGWVDAVEAQAEKALGHDEQAAQGFAAAARKPFPNPQIALDVAMEMKRAGESRLALELLLTLEPWFNKNAEYWQAVYELVDARKQDSVLLLRAARELRNLRPSSPAVRCNYGLALVANRLEPAEAVVLTREALEMNPESPEAKVNHALALVQNRRFDDAAELLQSVNPFRFDEYGRSVFSYCLFELELGRGNVEQAMLAAAKVQTNHLFPTEIEWFRKEQSLHAPKSSDH